MTDTDPRDFQLIAFFPADHAEAVNGKLYVNGGCWDRVQFPVFPQVLPSLSIVAVLEVPFGANNADHKFVIGMEDPDGKPMPFRAEGNFRLGTNAFAEYGDPTVMPIALPVHNLVFERPGYYSLTCAVDGTELGRFRIRVAQVAIPMTLPMGPPPQQREAS